MNKSIWSIISLLFSASLSLTAQTTTPTFSISGQVKDATTQQEVPFANVLIYPHQDSVLLEGTNADVFGKFTIKLPAGNYDIVLHAIGYQDIKKENISLNAAQATANLKTIFLPTDTETLAEVEVIAERNLVEYGLEKKVFNVGKDLNAVGGSAQEVLQNVPSVEVDVEGNVSLRGSNEVTIFINGKPSGLTQVDPAAALQQIPADLIKQIEVINNPSAKYVAEGTAGIINIITKRPSRGSFNANATLTIGTNNKYDGGLSINFSQKNVNYYASYNARSRERWRRGTEDRLNLLPDSTFRVQQVYDGEDKTISHTVQTGADISLSEKTTLGIGGIWTWRDNHRMRIYDNLFLSENDDVFEDFQQNLDRNETIQVQEYFINFKQNFAQKGQQISFNGTYSTYNNDLLALFDLQAGSLGTIPPISISDFLRNEQGNANDFTLLQLDYVQPKIGADIRLETGLRADLRQVGADFAWLESDAETPIMDLSNQYRYDEQIYAGYVNLSRRWEKLEAQFGLRAEQTIAKGELLNTTTQFPNDYFNVFPSGALTYQLKNAQKLQASFSRRITRPRIRELNPAVFLSSPLQRRQGNPNLQPAFTNVSELSYLKNYKKGTFSTGIYYRQTENSIRRFVEVDREGNRFFTFKNIGSGQTYGLELSGSYKATKWLSFNGSGNFYVDELDVTDFAGGLRQKTGQFSLRLLSRLRFWKDWSGQVSAYYRSPGVMPQGRYATISFVDIAIRKPIFKGQGNISLRASDIFNTRTFELDMEGENFMYNAFTQVESRVIYIGFTYRLRKNKAKKPPRRARLDMKVGDDN